ncbi:hypothetical protein II906_09260 [bacterium]|nr:hypothetical protein [bacterium]
MITSYYTMQNALMQNNLAQAQMMQASNAMMSPVSFGNSQPLKPSFTGDTFELQNKQNETKVSVFQKLYDAIQKKLGKDIDRSTPKYGGINYTA